MHTAHTATNALSCSCCRRRIYPSYAAENHDGSLDLHAYCPHCTRVTIQRQTRST